VNPAVREAAWELVRRAETAGVRGRLADTAQMAALVRDTGGVLPVWYFQLLTTIPLCDLEIGWCEFGPTAQDDGMRWMFLSNPANIRSASLERYPGVALLTRGYINLAGDSSGSGHPYFFPTDRGDDPPVYRFTYEVGDNVDDMIARRGVCVCGRLSDLLRAAPVMVWNEETASWTGVFGRIGE
jgi:hypothetical protein